MAWPNHIPACRSGLSFQPLGSGLSSLSVEFFVPQSIPLVMEENAVHGNIQVFRAKELVSIRIKSGIQSPTTAVSYSRQTRFTIRPCPSPADQSEAAPESPNQISSCCVDDDLPKSEMKAKEDRNHKSLSNISVRNERKRLNLVSHRMPHALRETKDLNTLPQTMIRGDHFSRNSWW